MLNPNPRGTRTVNSRRQAAHRAVPSSAAITALAVLLAACGSSSSSSTSSSGSSPGATSGNRTALTACLRIDRDAQITDHAVGPPSQRRSDTVRGFWSSFCRRAESHAAHGSS